MKTLIAIKTCHKPSYMAKAHAQRETWVKDVRGFADVIFFHGIIGAENFTAYDDEILLPVDGTYAGIPLKVQAICEWSYCHGYDRILLMDDDVFVIPRRLMVVPADQHYVGRFRGPHGGYPAYFASGFAYWLSREAMKIVAATKWNGDWMDERFVSNALALRGIFGYNDLVNYQVTGPFTLPDALVGRKPQGALFCEYGAEHQRQLYTLLGNAAPVEPATKLVAVPAVQITAEQFAKAPRDSAPIGKMRI